MSCRTRPTTRPWPTCGTRWPRPTTPTTRARPSCCTSWPWRGKAISPWPTGCIAIATSLCSAALAHLALGFAAMDRKATAEEILGLLEKRNLDDAAIRRGPRARAAWRVALEPFAGRAAGALRPGDRRGLRRSRPRPRNWSIGSWPIAPATAGPRKRRPARRPWPCAAGSPTAASAASATS